MSDVETYEILVLGSGGAGKFLAWTMAKEGHRTAEACSASTVAGSTGRPPGGSAGRSP